MIQDYYDQIKIIEEYDLKDLQTKLNKTLEELSNDKQVSNIDYELNLEEYIAIVKYVVTKNDCKDIDKFTDDDDDEIEYVEDQGNIEDWAGAR